MILFEIALMILSVALIISISLKFFWVASFLVLYRAVSAVITFNFFQDKFGVEQHFFYFIFILVIVVSLHHLIIWFTRNTIIIRYIVYIILIIWVLYKFDFREIFLLADWLEARGVDLTWSGLKKLFVDLATTPPGEYFEVILRFLNSISEAIKKIFNTIFNRG